MAMDAGVPTDSLAQAPRPLEHLALRTLEGILELGVKDTTYKFALLRAITDHVREHPTETGDQHGIPIAWIATKWLSYYWPLLQHSSPIPQAYPKRGKRETAVSGYIEDYARDVAATGVRAGRVGGAAVHEPWGWFHIEQELRGGMPLDPATIKLILQVRATLLDQPIRKLPNLPGARAEVIGLRFGDDVAWDAGAFAGAIRDATARRATAAMREADSLHDLHRRDRAILVLPASLYDAIRRTRFWVRGAVLAEWALFSTRIAVRTGRDVHGILDRLQETDGERDSTLTNRYRRVIRGSVGSGTLLCVWCARSLADRWQLDHILPWSRYPVDAFWNLAPSCTRCNGTKSNKLVEMTDVLEGRLGHHFERMIGTGDSLVQADLAQLPHHGIGKAGSDAVVAHVLGLQRELAETAGVGRWTPPGT